MEEKASFVSDVKVVAVLELADVDVEDEEKATLEDDEGDVGLVKVVVFEAAGPEVDVDAGLENATLSSAVDADIEPNAGVLASVSVDVDVELSADAVSEDVDVELSTRLLDIGGVEVVWLGVVVVELGRHNAGRLHTNVLKLSQLASFH